MKLCSFGDANMCGKSRYATSPTRPREHRASTHTHASHPVRPIRDSEVHSAERVRTCMYTLTELSSWLSSMGCEYVRSARKGGALEKRKRSPSLHLALVFTVGFLLAFLLQLSQWPSGRRRCRLTLSHRTCTVQLHMASNMLTRPVRPLFEVQIADDLSLVHVMQLINHHQVLHRHAHGGFVRFHGLPCRRAATDCRRRSVDRTA